MPLFEPNVDLLPPLPLTAWRKIAYGTWKSANEARLQGVVRIDATHVRALGGRYSQTAIMAKAIALGIQAYPQINSIWRRGKLQQRSGIHVYLQVLPDRRRDDLSGMIVRDCDRKSLAEIQEEIRARAALIRSGRDPEFESAKALFRWLPTRLVGPLLRTLGWVFYELNWFVPWLGVSRDGFGSAMVTSLAPFGIDEGYGPLDEYSRCPLVITLGSIEDRPVLRDGRLENQPVLPVCATLDHRVIDANGCRALIRRVRRYLEEELAHEAREAPEAASP